jgi:adenylosuccinate lyase
MDKGLAREKAYDLVQRAAMKTWRGQAGFKENLVQDKEVLRYLDRRTLDKIFDLDYYLRNVNKIFQRVGLS